MPQGKDPVYLAPPIELVELETVCSWCGVNVPTKSQQIVHTNWHRAAGVVPLHTISQNDVTP